MRSIIAPVVCAFAVAFGLSCAMEARAQDAGPQSVDVASKQSNPAPALTDPVADSGGYARDMQNAFKAGQWALLVVLSLFGLARGLLWASARWSVAWLKRATPALVAASAALAAVGASLSAGGSLDWRALGGALAMVLALYLSPHPKAGE